jgi:hypothetical protein
MFKGLLTTDHLGPTFSFTNPNKCPRIDQNNPESNWWCLVGIATNPEFKIRLSSTTSKEGLKRLNIHEGNNKDLTPGSGGQFFPAKDGQGYWLCHYYSVWIITCYMQRATLSPIPWCLINL